MIAGGETILMVHTTDAGRSPLQCISADLLPHYQRCEAQLAAIRSSQALGPVADQVPNAIAGRLP